MWVLPPIKSIVHFESAARLQSFKKAAEELNITPGAISHQISKLELFVGKDLFVRGSRKIKLTNCGLRYYSRISLILEDLETATTDLGVKNPKFTLKISLPTALLKCWLMPEIVNNAESYANFDIEFIDTLDHLDKSNYDVDLSIRYGYETWDDMYSVHLFDEKMIPVCSPSYWNKAGGKLNVGQVESLTWLYINNRLVQWDLVFQRLSFPKHINYRKLTFQNSIQAIEAATQGLGIAFVNTMFVTEELRSGRLVKPFDISLPEGKVPSYFLVSTSDKMQQPQTAMAFQSIIHAAKETCNNIVA